MKLNANGWLPFSTGFVLWVQLFPPEEIMQCCFQWRRKTLHQDFACSHLAKATRSAVFLLCPLPQCPAALLPSHHHLFPGTTLCPPMQGRPRVLTPSHHTHTQIKKEEVCCACLCLHPNMWKYDHITHSILILNFNICLNVNITNIYITFVLLLYTTCSF